jgi:hypothetical protein
VFIYFFNEKIFQSIFAVRRRDRLLADLAMDQSMREVSIGLHSLSRPPDSAGKRLALDPRGQPECQYHGSGELLAVFVVDTSDLVIPDK